MPAPFTVLIVEDNPSDAELTISSLQRTWPTMAWSCVDTEANFRQCLSQRPDVIIADYEVPSFGAVPALAILSELGLEIPLIVLTGAVSEEIVVECMRLGAADYLLKDRMTRLCAAVSNALNMRRQRDEKRLAEEQLRINANALRQLTEGVVIADAALHAVTVNKAFTTITGYAPHEVLGLPVNEFLTKDYPQTFLTDILTHVNATGGWKGEVQSRRRSGELFPALCSVSAVRNENGIAQYYTAVFTDLSNLREVEQRIEYLSQHDSLTGLPNRASLETHLRTGLAYAEAGKLGAALLLIELDRFKNVNDTLGHITGDKVLKAVAERIEQIKPSDGVLGRMGGDEFMLLLLNMRWPNEAGALAESVRVALQAPFVIDEHRLFITASVGIGCFPADGSNFEALLRAADAAVHQAKAQGRNSVAFFSAAMSDAALERFTLQNSLPQAIARGELLLEFQPTVDLATGKVCGAEALIRWAHPQLGLLGPNRFIGLAEDTGLIVEIGEWVLRSACEQVKGWERAGWSSAIIAVNLSARQFTQGDLPQVVERILAQTQLAPSQLRLEITESMMMHDPAATEQMLLQLIALGVSIAIDDFGTGYSSLSYLKRFRVDCLKVDKSFVNGVPGDRGDESIVRAIIALGKTLDMKIVAEGVEKHEQARFVSHAGCDEAQGYFYSRPVSPEKVLALALGGHSVLNQP